MAKTEDKTQTPAEQVAAGTCPECQAELKDIDPAAHAGNHWRGQGSAAPQQGTDAYARQSALLGKGA